MQCGEFVGEYGEEEIYESFVGGKSLFVFMCSKGNPRDCAIQFALTIVVRCWWTECHGDDLKLAWSPDVPLKKEL